MIWPREKSQKQQKFILVLRFWKPRCLDFFMKKSIRFCFSNFFDFSMRNWKKKSQKQQKFILVLRFWKPFFFWGEQKFFPNYFIKLNNYVFFSSRLHAFFLFLAYPECFFSGGSKHYVFPFLPPECFFSGGSNQILIISFFWNFP